MIPRFSSTGILQARRHNSRSLTALINCIESLIKSTVNRTIMAEILKNSNLEISNLFHLKRKKVKEKKLFKD